MNYWQQVASAARAGMGRTKIAVLTSRVDTVGAAVGKPRERRLGAVCGSGGGIAPFAVGLVW